MRRVWAVVVVALGLLPAVSALAQIPSSPGGLRREDPLDALRDSTRRPLPTVPPRPTPPSGRDVWVPDRQVTVPGVAGPVHVPGHWERRISDREVYTPPLVGVAPDGSGVYFPGGVRPVPELRQSP